MSEKHVTDSTNRVTAPKPGDTAIDLRGIELVDLTRDEMKALARPRSNWIEVAEQVAAVYPQVADQLGLGKFDPATAINNPIARIAELAPYEAWLEKALEMVRETRAKAASDAWRAMLKVYRRANDVALEDPRVAKAFRFVSDYLATDSTREQAAGPTGTTATNTGPR
ncbi:MAG: hypothetical protein HYY84_09980 [Deltaproteobacteria bacterium]|nr:hypothetical protein [Deltaproteobacteria bacterium]